MIQWVRQIEDEMTEIFTHLHEHPELSWEERATTAYLQQQLEQEGLCTTTYGDIPGVVGEWGTGDVTVALRADMDALWQEVNGVWRANHSCGHDAHMTLVLGAVKLLKRMGYEPPGKIKVIFQPAEEKGTGALKMLELGAVDDVDYLYGVHLRPVQELPGGVSSPSIRHGACRMIDGVITGTSAHAARPHLGVNAIEVAAALVRELGMIHTDPQVPSSIKMTRLQAGGKSGNIIPETAEFTLDLRAQTNEVMADLAGKLERIVNSLALLYDAKIELQPGAQIAAAEVDPEAEELLRQAVTKVLGAERCAPGIQTSGGEDFHTYTLRRPQLKATMLGLGCDLQPGLHHPQMTFDRRELFNGMQILATAVIETFQQVRRVPYGD